MTDFLLGLTVVALATSVAWVVYLARERRIKPPVVRALAGLCALGLAVMLLTDWPSEVLSNFWAAHSILAGIASTVLLVGIVFLAFEDNEQRAQEILDGGLTATGLGGIVDHVVDVEVALSLVSGDKPPDAMGWDGWAEASRPLRWLRENRSRLARCPSGTGGPSELDPRSQEATWPTDETHRAWRSELVDQCIRRLLAAIRDWSPVIGQTRNGAQVLLALSELRRDLMELESYLRTNRAHRGEPLLLSLRQRARVLAHFFEAQSGADPLRDEVLTSFEPLRPVASLEWAADSRGHRLFSKGWREELQTSQRLLVEGTRIDGLD